ncbi:Protein-L-isoaspartate O-methyltransferase [compost metagenome]
MASQVEYYQNLVIQNALPLNERVVEAFYHCPRHFYVRRYRPAGHSEWIDVTTDTRKDHLAQIYEDKPLMLYEEKPFVSTLSQPSFVLRILDMLQIEPGNKIFELGTGSGWNAALMAYLTGPEGKVITSEIIPEMADRARASLIEQGVSNVKVITGDGFEGAAQLGPYDRIIFTAGSKEFPEKLFAQLKEKGMMVFVRRQTQDYDSLELIRKKDGKQEKLFSSPCAFVAVIRQTESSPIEKEI